MVRFINADPYGRRHLSQRKSFVLYDGRGVFGYALNERPSDGMLRKLYEQTSVRYWSKGILIQSGSAASQPAAHKYPRPSGRGCALCTCRCAWRALGMPGDASARAQRPHRRREWPAQADGQGVCDHP